MKNEIRSEITYLFWLTNVVVAFCPEESLYKLETTAKHIIQNAIKHTNQSAVKHTTHTAVKHDPYCTKIHHHTAVAYTMCSAMLQAIQKARDHDIPKGTAIMIFGRILCALVLFCWGCAHARARTCVCVLLFFFFFFLYVHDLS